MLNNTGLRVAYGTITTMTDPEWYDCEEEEEENLEPWIPEYLKPFIIPYHDEFCYTHVYHHRLVAALMMEGFLPIADEGVILPKLHHKRCVVSLPEGLHVSKSIRKKSKKFRFTTNKCFDRVVHGCRNQHGPRCWLYPDLVKVFKEIYDAGQVKTIVNPSRNMATKQEAIVRMFSIEIWNEETNELVAGELGYTVGNIYTSLTGFSAQDSAGSVQLASVGRMLSKLGFALWDLGMDMEYKQGLGSHLMSRKDFVAHVANVRVTQSHNRLPITDSTGFNCKSLIDQTLSREELLSGSEPKVAPMEFVFTPTNAKKKKQKGTSLEEKDDNETNTVDMHYSRSNPDNQDDSPPKKRRSIVSK